VNDTPIPEISQPRAFVYSKAPDMIFGTPEYDNLSETGGFVYLYLIYRLDKNSLADPPIMEIARDTKKSVREVKRGIQELTASGLIDVQKNGRRNVYTVMFPDETTKQIGATLASIANTTEATPAPITQTGATQSSVDITTEATPAPIAEIGATQSPINPEQVPHRHLSGQQELGLGLELEQGEEEDRSSEHGPYDDDMSSNRYRTFGEDTPEESLSKLVLTEGMQKFCRKHFGESSAAVENYWIQCMLYEANVDSRYRPYKETGVMISRIMRAWFRKGHTPERCVEVIQIHVERMNDPAKRLTKNLSFVDDFFKGEKRRAKNSKGIATEPQQQGEYATEAEKYGGSGGTVSTGGFR